MEDETARRGKRNKANRASAARSKVRKMRLIAELESKQAILQEQVVNMTAEVQMLQGETMRIGHENEWLASQVRLLEGQSDRLDHEAQSHLLHSTTPPPAEGLGGLQSDSSINVFGHVHEQAPGYDNLPQSAFEVAQDQGLTSVQIPQRQILPSTLPRHQSFAAMAGHFRGGDAALGGLLPPGQTPVLAPTAALSEPLGGTWTTLNSSQGSDAFSGSALSRLSGMSSTTQELQLPPMQPENAALLDMLQNFDLRENSPWTPALPYPSGPNPFEHASSLGMNLAMPHNQRLFANVPMLNTVPNPIRMGSLPPSFPAGPRDSRHSSWLSEQSPTFEARLQQPPLMTQMGLARWPRHISEPLSGGHPSLPRSDLLPPTSKP